MGRLNLWQTFSGLGGTTENSADARRRDQEELARLRKQVNSLRNDLKAVRCAATVSLPIADISDIRCSCCGSRNCSICRYPCFKSLFFSGRLLANCADCGLSWLPEEDLDLETYYTHHYAEEFRAERLWDGRFYSEANPVWSKPKHSVRDRSKRLYQKIEPLGPFHSVLDIGAGEGFFLNLVDADRKYADELDTASQRVLTEELGVQLTSVEEIGEEVDLVLASHVLEHFTFDTIRQKIDAILAALRPGGFFICEVPDGARQIELFLRGERPFSQRLEPHTLFFSSYSLCRLLSEQGFDIVEAKICRWSHNHISSPRQDRVLGDADTFFDGPLTVLARRPD